MTKFAANSSMGTFCFPLHDYLQMAKSAINRHHAKRIAANWQREIKAYNYEWMLNRLGFGFTYKQDPYDCGIVGCYCCHEDKSYSKRDRLQARRDEREAWEDLDENSSQV